MRGHSTDRSATGGLSAPVHQHLAPNSNTTVFRFNTELQQFGSPARYGPQSRCHWHTGAFEPFGHNKHQSAEIIFFRSRLEPDAR
jgi:hypothetical protein